MARKFGTPEDRTCKLCGEGPFRTKRMLKLHLLSGKCAENQFLKGYKLAVRVYESLGRKS